MRNVPLRLIVISLFVLVMVPLAHGQMSEDTDLVGTQWELESIDGESVLEGTSVTLSFGEDGRASGSGGCNSYGGSYSINDTSISFGQMISTMMACEEGIMAQEMAYFQALETASGISVEGDTLIINYGAEQELRFSRLTLVGTTWELTSLAGSDVVEGTTVTLTLGEENAVTGDTGCNVYRGSYMLDGQSIAFGPLLTTRRACLSDEAAAQEQAFLAALENASDYVQQADQLTINTTEGEQLIFMASLTLEGTSWQLDTLAGNELVPDSSITMEFDSEGRVAGSASCNRYTTSYIVDGNSLGFGMAAATMMACEPALMEQERAFFNALETASTFELSQDQLIITYADGLQLVFSPMANEEEAATGTVTAEVTYRERMALPDNAEITVELQDISLADAPAVVIASETRTADGAQVPFTFELSYDPAEILENHRYAVRAEVRVDGELLFTTDQIYPVITMDNPNDVTIVMIRVAS